MDLPERPLDFTTFDEITTWCAANGGEEALQQAMAHGYLHTRAMLELGERWLRLQADKRNTEAAREAIAVAVAAAKAAERSARYTMWSACVSATALLIATLTYLFKA